MAAKKHYFGVGGGTRRFLSVAEKDGKFGSKNIVIVILFMLDCSPKKDVVSCYKIRDTSRFKIYTFEIKELN